MMRTDPDVGLENATDDRTFTDRFFQLAALQPGVVKPLLMWLSKDPKARGERDRCFGAIESWLLRIRLTGGNPGNHARFRNLRDELGGQTKASLGIAAKLIKSLGELPNGWPTNDQVCDAVVSKPVRRAVHREMARMVLEAIESHLGGDPHSTDLEIEHIMPLKWEDGGWPPSSVGDSKDREKAILTLGNLTLVPGRVNTNMGNNRWSFKKEKLRQERRGEQSLKLNDELLDQFGETCWTDETIRERGRRLAKHICCVWPRATAS